MLFSTRALMHYQRSGPDEGHPWLADEENLSFVCLRSHIVDIAMPMIRIFWLGVHVTWDGALVICRVIGLITFGVLKHNSRFEHVSTRIEMGCLRQPYYERQLLPEAILGPSRIFNP